MKLLFICGYLLRSNCGAQNSAKAHLQSLREIVGETSDEMSH